MSLLLGLVAVALLAVFLNVALGIVKTDRPRSGSGRLTMPPGEGKKVYPARRSPYRATSIVNRGNSCAAVRNLLHVKFLDVDGRPPAVPVTSCNIGHCNCEYVHHADRRESDADRRSPHALTSDLYDQSGKIDRRVSRGGRRKNDFNRLKIRYSIKDIQFQS